MFESLSDKLGGIFDKLKGRGALTEEHVAEATREIRVALLEADVALPVVKDFIESVKTKAVGHEVIKSVTPVQQVVKIVNDAMVEMLGGAEAEALNLKAAPPVAILMVGLQGSGKTTSTAKIAKFLTDKQRKKVLMASLDVARPAAQEQLAQLGTQTGVATLEIIAGQQPKDIAKRALDTARKEGYDVVMLDTAGRLSIDAELMQEVADVSAIAKPAETLMVADAMTGQDAVNVAKAFDEKVGITGIMLTRVDGDARGGAAMSMRGITGKPIKLIGTGEKWTEIEPFHPERIASRILGMGDVVSLVERAAENVDRDEAAKMAKKLKKGEFNFNDLLSQMKQMQKMGGVGEIMKMLPGMDKAMRQATENNIDDKLIKRQEAIILSMTPDERENPKLMNASRKKRIAAGAGLDVQDVNKLCKQQQQMQLVMKRMKKMGMGKIMGMTKGLLGGKDQEMLEQMTAEEGESGPLGPNPFANAPIGGLGGVGGGLPGLGSGMGRMPGMGLPGMQTRGGTNKNRKKGKRK